jgi:hypothetical protein
MSERQDRASKWLNETPEGGRALEAIGCALEALETESRANGNEARSAAQASAIAAGGVIEQALGLRDLRRRRMMTAAQSDAIEFAGANADAAGYDAVAREALDGSQDGRRCLRRMAARCVMDMQNALGAQMAQVLAGALLGTAAGYDGLMTEPVKAAGVDPKDGPAHFPEFWGEVQPPALLKGLDIPSRRADLVPWKPSRRRGCGRGNPTFSLRNQCCRRGCTSRRNPPFLREKIVFACGYTAGVEGADRPPAALWQRAARCHNEKAGKLRQIGEKVADATVETVRDWQKRRLRTLFNKALDQGRRERGRPNPEWLLPPL